MFKTNTVTVHSDTNSAVKKSKENNKSQESRNTITSEQTDINYVRLWDNILGIEEDVVDTLTHGGNSGY